MFGEWHGDLFLPIHSATLPPSISMFRHYITLAFRNLFRSKAFSAINVLGLALGMACSLLVYLWVEDERRVDNFHANGDRLFGVYQRTYLDGKVEAAFNNSALLAPELKKVIPEISHATGVVTGYEDPVQIGEQTSKLRGGQAGVDFFSMFSYPLLQGNPRTALESPNGMAVSRRVAERYYGSTQAAVGKTIRMNSLQKTFTVSAVFENLPRHASDQFDFLTGWDAWVAAHPALQSWEYNCIRTYIQLRPGADPAKVAAKMEHFLDAYVKQTPGRGDELGLQRFGDRYLVSAFEHGKPAGGRIEYVRLFTGVVVFILLIACINFMNLTTARSVRRGKEIGVRKVAGAARTALIGQFLGEALLLALLAGMLAVLLVMLVLPLFNGLTGKELSVPFFSPAWWLAMAAGVGITGLVAGSYPAFFLAALQPVKVLKGTLRFGTGAVRFRQVLVVFQFMLATLLIVGTLVVSLQTRYVESKHLGYDRENLLYIPLEGDLLPKFEIFRQQASRLPGIKRVDRISQPRPQDMQFLTLDIHWEGKDPNAKIRFTPVGVGHDFVKLMNLKITRGRDFSRSFSTDSAGFLVNETAVRRMGLRNPVGTPFSFFDRKGKIIGVLKDFHFNSLHQPIEPLVVRLEKDFYFGAIMVRTEAGNTREVLGQLGDIYRRLNPAYPFTYTFAEEAYGKLYQREQAMGKLSNAFAGLAIVISCLGLLGLAMFSAEQRTKEIGIRKILGASAGSILALFTRDFLKLVVLSFLVAAPVAGLLMRKWLEGFAYKIGLSWWIFALAGGATLLVTLLTVSFQAVKAALANPVESLRSE
jgi:predicted permease